MPVAQASQKAAGGGASLYYEIANFQAGMDLRKSPLTAPAGTLRMLQNAHITQGGEIEKREAFQYWCNAPAGSMGLCTDNNGNIYTHLPSGTPGVIDPPTATSIGVIHIAQPPGDTLIYQLDHDVFNGQIYAVFQSTTQLLSLLQRRLRHAGDRQGQFDPHLQGEDVRRGRAQRCTSAPSATR